MRELSRRFGMTLSTTRNAVQELVNENILESIPGVGIRVKNAKPRKAKAERRIAVYCENIEALDPQESYSAHALRGFQEEAALASCRVDVRFHDFYMASEALQVTAEEVLGCQALLFLGSFDWSGVRYPAGVPAVGLSMSRAPDPQISLVGPDPFWGSRLAADYFCKRGKKHVIVFSSNTRLAMWSTFRTEFENIGSVELLRIQDNAVPLDWLNDPDAGYFFTFGTLYHHTAGRYFRQFGRDLAADRTVLAFDGKSRIIPGYSPVPNIGIDWTFAGRTAFRECLYRMEHPWEPGRKILITPDLQEINSI